MEKKLPFINRRSLIAAGTVAAVLVAGCTSDSETTARPRISPSIQSTPKSTPIKTLLESCQPAGSWSSSASDPNPGEIADRLGIDKSYIIAGQIGRAICNPGIANKNISNATAIIEVAGKGRPCLVVAGVIDPKSPEADTTVVAICAGLAAGA